MKRISIFLGAVLMFQLVNAQSVGIGTTSPNASAMLDVTSTTGGLLIPRMTAVQRRAVVSPTSGLIIYQTNSELVTPFSRAGFYIYSFGVWKTILDSDDKYWTKAGGNNWIYTNTDSIGIGTANPNEKLHIVNGSIYVQDNRSNQNPNLIFDVPAVNGNQAGLQFKRSGDTLASIGFVENTGVADYIRIGLNNAGLRNDLTINTNGEVGVGTANPNEKLHIVDGSIYVQDNRSNQNPNLIFDVPAVNGNQGGLQFKRSGDTLASIVYVENTNVANYIRIGLNNAGTRNDFTINTNGEVGVGTLSPAGQMQLSNYTGDNLVINDADGIIQFSQPQLGAPVKKGFMQLTANGDLRVGTNSGNINGGFVIRTNGADRMYVDETGNVSIGTTSTAAGYKLHIGGKAICEELKVQLVGNWPDYVFEKKYSLASIKDVKNYIEANKHLPGIPSALEVEKNGIEVGDMQKKLLQKVEELTLYIVQLKEEIDALKTKTN